MWIRRPEVDILCSLRSSWSINRYTRRKGAFARRSPLSAIKSPLNQIITIEGRSRFVMGPREQKEQFL